MTTSSRGWPSGSASRSRRTSSRSSARCTTWRSTTGSRAGRASCARAAGTPIRIRGRSGAARSRRAGSRCRRRSRSSRATRAAVGAAGAVAPRPGAVLVRHGVRADRRRAAPRADRRRVRRVRAGPLRRAGDLPHPRWQRDRLAGLRGGAGVAGVAADADRGAVAAAGRRVVAASRRTTRPRRSRGRPWPRAPDGDAAVDGAGDEPSRRASWWCRSWSSSAWSTWSTPTR